MKLPIGLTTPEIRILQEYRRLETAEMSLDQIQKILHPTRIDNPPVKSLVEKGFLTESGNGESLTLTDVAREFLERKAEPETAGVEAGSA